MAKQIAIEVKAQTETLYTFQVFTNNAEHLLSEISNLTNNNKKQFENAPVILEIEDVNFQANELAILVEMLTQNNIVTIGVRTRQQQLIDFAKFSGLALFNSKASSNKLRKPSKKIVQDKVSKSSKNKVYQAPKIVADKVHSSSQILAKGRDLVLLNNVKAGAEVMADGSISAYKEVQGSVFAGISGNEKALIFIHSFNAQLVCIAGVYKKFDTVPVKLYARPVMIDLADGQLRFQII